MKCSQLRLHPSLARISLAIACSLAALVIVSGSIVTEHIVTAQTPAQPSEDRLREDVAQKNTSHWKLLEPFWASSVIHGESVLFLQANNQANADGKLLLPPSRIERVALANGSQVFEEGRDYLWQAGDRMLTVPAGSRIPIVNESELYPAINAPHSLAHKAGDPQRGVLFDNEHYFHDLQVEVTYETQAVWDGYRPQIARQQLSKTLAKLTNGEALTIGVTGDSITYGLNASGLTGVAPWQPVYPELVADQLAASFGSKINLVNRAISGWRLENGLQDLDALLASKPDLIIIAYGMNHFGSRDANGFRQLQTEMIERIRQALPDCEMILVAPMHGNVNWVHTPGDQFEPHRQVLAELAGEGIAFADLTTLWGQMLQHKRDIDLTGNGVNHPNDFGHRVYASAVLGLLIEPTTSQSTFPNPVNTEPSSAQPMAADEVVSTTKVPTGFQLTPFAAEPDVQNPIAIATDAKGRLWVAENYTWAGSSLGNYRTDLRDRIIVLEDRDGDGIHDRRTVFWDKATKLTSIEVGDGGIWAICLPQLLFIPDADGDDVPDGPPQVILDGMNEDSVGHTPANGLRWGPDGWLYARHGILATSSIGPPNAGESQRIKINTGVWRYHPTTKQVETVMHGMTNSWGFDYTNEGEMFCINTVIGHLWHVIPGGRTERMFGVDMNPRAYQLLPQVADHVHWDTGEVWHDVRSGVSDTTSAAGGGHAHIGLMVYQGNNWPAEYRDKIYTLNLHGRRINCDHVKREGAGFVATHGEDFVTFSDPFFRGMDLISGADGAVFIADWSDTGECHDHDGVHRTSGRIYKLAYQPNLQSTATSEDLDLNAATDDQLIDNLSHNNSWHVRHSLRILQQRLRNQTLTPAAIKRLQADHSRLHAWVLNAALDVPSVQLLDSASVADRVWGLRLLADQWTPTQAAINPAQLAHLQTLASKEQDGLVLLHLASALQRMPFSDRVELATRLAQRSEFAEDRFFPIMLWLGIEPAIGDDPHVALHLITTSKTELIAENCARRLGEDFESHRDAIDRLVAIAIKADAPRRRSVVVGLGTALAGWSQIKAPKQWSQLSELASIDADDSLQRMIDSLNVIFGDGQAIEQLRKIAVDGGADPTARRRAIAAIAVGKDANFEATLLDLLGDRAVHQVAIEGLLNYDSDQTPSRALANLHLYEPVTRKSLIKLLSSRPRYAVQLLTAVRDERIAVEEISAFDARQIRGFEVPELNQLLLETWGDVRPTAADKLATIEQLKSVLATSDAKRDLSHGRELFNKVCANCHVLYGQGSRVGPDLTGSNRQNLDYLLENIVDPSASVGNDFRTTQFVLDDGRFISGVVLSENPRTVSVQTPDGIVTIEQATIEEAKQTSNSLMPEALLQNLSEQELRDLFAYLQSTRQAPLASDSPAPAAKQ